MTDAPPEHPTNLQRAWDRVISALMTAQEAEEYRKLRSVVDQGRRLSPSEAAKLRGLVETYRNSVEDEAVLEAESEIRQGR